MKRYEAVLVFDSSLTDSDVSQQLEKIDATVKSHSGTVERQDIWGRRELAYKIEKKSHGIYVVMVITGDNTLVVDLRRQLRINDVVMRFLIVDKDKYAPDAGRPSDMDRPAYREGRGSDDRDQDGDDASAQ